MISALSLVVGLAILAGIWGVLRAPLVDEARCIFEDVRQGLTKCGGCSACARDDGNLPCVERRR